MLVLRPDDVSVSFSSADFDIGGTNFNDIHAQSVSIEAPLARDSIDALGAERAVARPLAFPIDVTMSVSALLKQFNDGALDLILTGTADENQTNITVNITDQTQVGANKWILQNCVLDSQNFSLGLDDNESVDLTFSAQIGGAKSTTDGLFMSGLFADKHAAAFGVRNDISDPTHTYLKNNGGPPLM